MHEDKLTQPKQQRFNPNISFGTLVPMSNPATFNSRTPEATMSFADKTQTVLHGLAGEEKSVGVGAFESQLIQICGSENQPDNTASFKLSNSIRSV